MIDQNNSLLLSTYLQTLFLTIIIGAIVSSIYYLTKFTYEKLQKAFLSTITIENSDPLFSWILEFISESGFLLTNMNKLTCKIERSHASSFFFLQNNDVKTDKERPVLNYTPSEGFHNFFYKGKKIYINHKSGKKNMKVGYEKKIMKLEKLVIICKGSSNINILKSLCEEAMQKQLEKTKNLTNIYALHEWIDTWEKVQSKIPRSLNSVILDENMADLIIKDVISFQNSFLWYSEMGVPYHRGYLLYGPPGTGKTSFVLALAGHLKMSICPINLSGNEMNDEKFSRILEKVPRNAIILLEDIDALFAEKHSIRETEGQKITFNGLINGLDGIKSQEGRVVFMSTNHIEKLNPALLRPGRIDVKIKLDYASNNQIINIFKKFFPDLDPCYSLEFGQKVPENKLSMAKLQGYFLRYKNDLKNIMENTHELVSTNETENEMSIFTWLFRLGLSEFCNGFFKAKIRRVADLKEITNFDLENFGIKKIGQRNRIMGMIKGDEEIKKGFQFMTKQSIRSFLRSKNLDNNEVEILVGIIPENFITEFHLRDIFDRKNNESNQELIENLIKDIEIVLKKKKKDKKEENEDNNKNEPKEVLEKLALNNYVNKFIENDCLDKETFYKLDDGSLSEIGVTLKGDRMRLLNMIKKINEKKNDEEFKNIDGFKKIFVKSSSIYY